MKTGEGKTLVATLPLYLNALAGQGRAPRHGQRLPGPPRRGVDGPDLRRPRPDRRRHPGRHGARGQRRRPYAVRHHLRHQQRVRLRLPARQHGGRPRRSACQRELHLRDRRRGRLDPDRRGAHAADHLGPARGGARHVLRRSPRSPAALERGRRLRGRREAQDRSRRPTRACTRSSSALGIENLYAPEQRPAGQPPDRRRSRPSRCTSATSSTSSRTARS